MRLEILVEPAEPDMMDTLNGLTESGKTQASFVAGFFGAFKYLYLDRKSVV